MPTEIRVNLFENLLSNFFFKVLPETTSSYLACSCDHLTNFAGQVLVPPTPVNLGDITLVGRKGYNPVVLSVILIAWTIFVLLLVWAHDRDRKEQMNVGIRITITNTLICVYAKFLVFEGKCHFGTFLLQRLCFEGLIFP